VGALWLLGGSFSATRPTTLPTLTDPGKASRDNRFPVTPQTRPEAKEAKPGVEPVPAETIEVDKEGRAGLKLTFPRIIPDK
jgi:hypothetical protein